MRLRSDISSTVFAYAGLTIIVILAAIVLLDRVASVEEIESLRALARSGAYVLIAMGFGAFIAGVAITRRISRRVIAPMEELHDASVAFRDGDLHRRSHLTTSSLEVSSITEMFNNLLDQRAQIEQVGLASQRDIDLYHEATSALLDEFDGPVLLMRTDEVAACNSMSLDLLSTTELKQLASEVVRHEDRRADGLRVVRLREDAAIIFVEEDPADIAIEEVSGEEE